MFGLVLATVLAGVCVRAALCMAVHRSAVAELGRGTHSALQSAARWLCGGAACPPPSQGGMEAVRDIRRTWSRYKTKIIAVTADAVSLACCLPTTRESDHGNMPGRKQAGAQQRAGHFIS